MIFIICVMAWEQDHQLDEVQQGFFRAAFDQALKSYKEGGVPIGAAMVESEKVIASGHNRRVQDGDPMAHGEMDCLRKAGRRPRYDGITLYTTLSPCMMCSGTILQFGIKEVVVGEDRNFPGNLDFLRDHGVHVILLNDPDCISLMQRFISERPDLWDEDIAGREMFKHSSKTEKALGAQNDAFNKRAESNGQKPFEHLYDCLSILDTKSSSLLAFNSIISAVFAIFMLANLPRYQSIVLNVGMAGILVSSLLLLWVVRIHWSPSEDLRDSRTLQYKTAWLCSFVAVVVLCVFLGIRFVQTFLPQGGST